MPIKIPSDLPAFNVLRNEGVMVMDDFKANRQDIRPLKIGLLNLMPKKSKLKISSHELLDATRCLWADRAFTDKNVYS